MPSCPGWSAADLLWHLTEVQLFWAAVLASGATTDEQVHAIEERQPVRPARRAEALARRERATEDLLAALRSGPLDAPPGAGSRPTRRPASPLGCSRTRPPSTGSTPSSPQGFPSPRSRRRWRRRGSTTSST
ncbi:maleylpyruvate isomerase N-terminal domain-containing protein [Tessaracoccus coleopterorum]|uniref:maleylpyruvate isomerase N-terminal domain-containing protein n=1 Tax=Tessaracoccus coleopterorum TaxID=2714950 RepID=UPI0038CDAD1B